LICLIALPLNTLIALLLYSSTGSTRLVLRYLSVAIDLESNIFMTRDEAMRAMLAVPLQVGDRTLDVLKVTNKDGGFIEDDKQLVTVSRRRRRICSPTCNWSIN